MAFEGLTEKLSATFKKLRGKGRLTENDVREAMREVRLALLEADVSYKVVKEFVAGVTERAIGSDVLNSLTPAQQVIKIVNEEMTRLMGGSDSKISMKDAVHPNEILLVVDAMTGQDAVNAASAFNDALGIDGVILTKLDGDARGGAALSIRASTGKPIKFAGTGEKLDMIEPFYPDRMLRRPDLFATFDQTQLTTKADRKILQQAKDELSSEPEDS